MGDRKVITSRSNGKHKAETAGPQPTVADPEVVPFGKRRVFTRAYKLRILRQVDGCRQGGEIGALLRSEGLYSSHLTTWRRQQDSGELGNKKRGKKGADPAVRELACLRVENQRLQGQLEKAKAIIEVQKKVSDLLGLTCQGDRKAEQK